MTTDTLPGTTDLPTAAELAAFTLEAQHTATHRWMDRAARLGHLTEEHEFDLQLATDLDLAAQRAEFLNAGPAAPAYLNRWVTVSADLYAMLSIRFEGLDVTKPFVDVSVTSRPVTRADLPALADAARAYAAFHSPRLRFWSAAPMTDWADLDPDRRVLAAPVGDLRGHPVPDDLTLVPTRDTSRHAEAQAAYDAVDAAHPHHPQEARLLSAEDLQEGIDAGTMFDVHWRGTWAGYAGTLAYPQLGLDAQVVQELLLAPHARGHGLGAALSTLLARHLPDPAQVLSGTIHGRNRGALNAAARAGRHDVGGWWWVPLP
ncbi:hypothetical protein [Deinococcus daejeonensis]|uniref:GCN5-related N-acetyltransferase n=1 Tax=Deinococcus daejeonensis TaxID=1007098 RepID=A0ABQ2ITT3_9DEIO|nr:hypothetical protein [Deinococcus daejeonensis]GGN30399.1 hypothetical protein GCM10010842_05660 [Deinococcus daejeonensis]